MRHPPCALLQLMLLHVPPTNACAALWQVFDEVSGLVTSILDGYNVCIMAYGQTGSGKTYTIEGPAEDPGVNSRALAELFRAAGERSTGFSYAFSASVLEIYNEQIFDLLAGSRDSGRASWLAGGLSKSVHARLAGCASLAAEGTCRGLHPLLAYSTVCPCVSFQYGRAV